MIKFVLRVEQLSKNFGALRALQNVSLAVEEGKVHAIIGPNGAGKTTLFNLICGGLTPSGGHIYFLDQSVLHLPLYRRVRLGLGRTFQLTNVFLNLTVLENVFLATAGKSLGLYAFYPVGSDSLSKAQQFLRRFPGLWEKQGFLARNLSYGEQRQLEIVLALALEPKLLLLDEPSSGLSLADIGTMSNFIREVCQENAVVLIEHDMDVVFDLADCITVLHQGQVLASGSKREIRADPRVREAYLGEEELRDARDE